MNLFDDANLIKPQPYFLKNRIQHYPWGTRGENAFIPKLLSIEAIDDTPYAELWMGAHPKASSEIDITGKYLSLDKLIQKYPNEILGEQVASKFSGKLPFLFKVLSAGELLSIQAHPNKDQAIALHKRDPEHYPDDNHKPEIAVALTSISALVGFKAFSEIIRILKIYPEISNFIGHDIVAKLQQSKNILVGEKRHLLKLMYSSLMNKSITDKEKLAVAIDQLEQRLKKKTSAMMNEEERLFLEYKKIYGADVGLLSIFLLNLIQLKSGQGVFLSAGIPHAYIKGDIVECMANSDNVIRAGLTTKFKDIDTLTDILTYDTEAIPIIQENPDQEEIIYKTPAQEFQITRLKLITGKERFEQSKNKPEILLVVEGAISISWEVKMECRKQKFHRGQSILVPAILNKYAIKPTTQSLLFKVEVP